MSIKMMECSNPKSCEQCRYAIYEQYKDYEGKWICLHPHRSELSNNGNSTYPMNPAPKREICILPAEAYSSLELQRQLLEEAPLPKWCYYVAVEREKVKNPQFDPDEQRITLYG